MEARRSTRRRLAVNPILLHKGASAAVTASSHEIDEGFDFDLHDLSTDDVQFILNRKADYKCHYKDEFHRQILDKIAIHGVKVHQLY